MFARSTDGGTTWEKPQVLSEQGDGQAVATVGKVVHSAYLPAIAVNKDGIIGVSWYDTRGLPTKQAGYNTRFRASNDGGRTWLSSVPVSTTATLWTAAVKQRYAQPYEEEGYWTSGPVTRQDLRPMPTERSIRSGSMAGRAFVRYSLLRSRSGRELSKATGVRPAGWHFKS